MPELPEVELAARAVRRVALGQRVVHVGHAPGTGRSSIDALRWIDLAGLTLLGVRRHGKQLAFDFSGDTTLLLHLGMTGRFDLPAPDEALAAQWRFHLDLENGQRLVFCDQRRFARARLMTTVECACLSDVSGLGPDAFEASLDQWTNVMSSASRPVKPLLLDQAKLAGIGNIYACEGLWRAGIDPRTPANAVSSEAVATLRGGVTSAIRDTLDRERDTLVRYLSEGGTDNPFDLYDREGKPCRRCGAPIERFTQAGRSTWHCPSCQPAWYPPSGPARSHRATSPGRSPRR